MILFSLLCFLIDIYEVVILFKAFIRLFSLQTSNELHDQTPFSQDPDYNNGKS